MNVKLYRVHQITNKQNGGTHYASQKSLAHEKTFEERIYADSNPIMETVFLDEPFYPGVELLDETNV